MPGDNINERTQNAMRGAAAFVGQARELERASELRDRSAKIQNVMRRPGGRETANAIASQSGDADLIRQTREQFASMDEAGRERASSRAQALGGLSLTLNDMNYEERVAALRSPNVRDFLVGNGFDEAQIDAFDPTDLNIQAQMGMVDRMQEALTTGFDARTLGAKETVVQRGQETQVNPNTASILETDRMSAQAQLNSSQARLQAAETGAAAEARQSLGQPSADRGTQFTQERQLRTDFTRITDDFRGINNSITVIRTMAQREDAQGDLALIVAFTKIMDPGSVAREGEVTLTQSSASIMQQAGNWLNRIEQGNTVLPAPVRQAFLEASEEMAAAYSSAFDLRAQEFSDIATDYGLDPSRVIVGHAAAPQTPGVPDQIQQQAPALTQAEIQREQERLAVPLTPEEQARLEFLRAQSRGN